MTGDELIAEGKRLARPCVMLKGDGAREDFVGVWRGRGIVPAPPGPYRHWLTFNCRFLPHGAGPLGGCLSVYTNDEVCEGGVAVHDPAQEPQWMETGQPLYGHAARSLPPIEGIFRFGSESVQQWLRDHNWQPEWGYNSNFHDPAPAKEYERLYQSECPLYSSDGAFAMLGGWHFRWPDGDWEELLDQSLIVWTFKESEPWVEVWNTGDGFRVIQRNT